MVRKDGSLIDVRLSAIMERDTSGQPVRSLAILEDVTEKHAVEAALHANQERLALATQANEIGIWELSLPQGKHLIVIRNTDLPSFSSVVNVTADQPINLKHKF